MVDFQIFLTGSHHCMRRVLSLSLSLSLSLRVQTVAGWSIRRLTHSSQQMLVAFATSRSTHRQHR